MGENIKILLIEDNLGDAYLIEEYLEEFSNFSYEFKTVGTLTEALSVLNNQPFDVILLYLILPDSYGVNTFIRIQNQNSHIPIIILTELEDEAIGPYAIKEAAHDFLVKGQMEDKLLERI
jgi:two-component system cell cycle sensor histidine kinase/response regulator CckA